MTSKSWPGWVKVKMLHRAGATVLLPEAVLIGPKGRQWVQPQYFYAPLLSFDDRDPSARIRVAAVDPRRGSEGGLELTVTFSRSARFATLTDSSELYRCEVESSHSPAALAVGNARLRDRSVDLRLFHHTTRDTLRLIHQSESVRGSAWNYQGTRELANVRYAYFTNLRKIERDADLLRMAMASDGRILLRLDSNAGSKPDLVLKVYRESTRNRKATLALWVPAESISTPHIWQHSWDAVCYEITHPWIFRVGLVPGAHLPFKASDALPDPALLMRFEYAVIGDCTTLEGLEAPFDEEDTKQTFLVQDLSGTDLFDFWKSHSNMDLHRLPPTLQEFQPDA